MSFFENFFKYLHAPYMFFYKHKNNSDHIISNHSQANLNQSNITQSYINPSYLNQSYLNQANQSHTSNTSMAAYYQYFLDVNNYVENIDYYETINQNETRLGYIRPESWLSWISWNRVAIVFIIIFLLFLSILICSLNRKVKLRARSTISLVQAKINRSQTV